MISLNWKKKYIYNNNENEKNEKKKKKKITFTAYFIIDTIRKYTHISVLFNIMVKKNL
jgi:hypothetical protein